MKKFSRYSYLVCLILLSVNAFASGMQGKYAMTGTAYYRGKALKKVVLVFTVASEWIVVRTTKTGAYWVEIPWSTPCPEGGDMRFLSSPEAVFPRYFTVDWNDKTLRVKSHTLLAQPGDTLDCTHQRVIVPISNEPGQQKDIIQNLYFR